MYVMKTRKTGAASATGRAGAGQPTCPGRMTCWPARAHQRVAQVGHAKLGCKRLSHVGSLKHPAGQWTQCGASASRPKSNTRAPSKQGRHQPPQQPGRSQLVPIIWHVPPHQFEHVARAVHGQAGKAEQAKLLKRHSGGRRRRRQGWGAAAGLSTLQALAGR